MLGFALALAGAVTLWLPAFRYRVDAIGCDAWTGPAAGALYSAIYVVAVTLLAAGWLRAQRREMPLARVLLLGAVVHLVAMVAPPFASKDPLYYAAIGRAMAQFHASAQAQLSTVLPAHDAFLQRLPPEWHDGTSPYGALFNQLAKLIALIGADNLTLQLRLYQLVGVATLLVTAFITGRAAGPRAAALILFCPVAIVDGTINPHNDVLLAPLFALFALALVRRREMPALLALLVAVAVKLSALLLLAFSLLRLVLRPLASKIRPAQLLVAGAAVSSLALAALVLAMRRYPDLTAFTALIGAPSDPPHFSRSFESAPRIYFLFIAHQPLTAWIIGLAVRATAGLWLLYAAFRAAREDAPLPWAATALFIYFFALHAFMQTWYLIPLLTLASWLPERLRPAFNAYVIGSTLYYALLLPLDCIADTTIIGIKEVAEGAIVLFPAAYLMLRARRTGSARASGESSPRAV